MYKHLILFTITTIILLLSQSTKTVYSFTVEEFDTLEWISRQYQLSWNVTETGMCSGSASGVTCVVTETGNHIKTISLVDGTRYQRPSPIGVPLNGRFYLPECLSISISRKENITTYNVLNYIRDLSKLTTLNVQYQQSVTEFPTGFPINLPLLNRLSVSGNRLTVLPTSIFQSNITHLLMFEHGLEYWVSLSSPSTKLVSLEVILSRTNTLYNFHSILFPNLKTLSLFSNNQVLSTKPTIYVNIPNLQSLLHCSYDNGATFDFNGSKNISLLHVQGNQTVVPNSLAAFPLLRTISLQLSNVTFSVLPPNTYYYSETSSKSGQTTFPPVSYFPASTYGLGYSYNDMTGSLPTDYYFPQFTASNNRLSGTVPNNYCQSSSLNFANNINLTDVADCFKCYWKNGVSSWFTGTSVPNYQNHICTSFGLSQYDYYITSSTTSIEIRGTSLGWGETIGTNGLFISKPNVAADYLVPWSKPKQVTLVFSSTINATINLIYAGPRITSTTYKQLLNQLLVDIKGEFVPSITHNITLGGGASNYDCVLQSINSTNIICIVGTANVPTGSQPTVTNAYGSATSNWAFYLDYPILWSHSNITTAGGNLYLVGEFSSTPASSVMIGGGLPCPINQAKSNHTTISCNLPANVVPAGIYTVEIIVNGWRLGQDRFINITNLTTTTTTTDSSSISTVNSSTSTTSAVDTTTGSPTTTTATTTVDTTTGSPTTTTTSTISPTSSAGVTTNVKTTLVSTTTTTTRTATTMSPITKKRMNINIQSLLLTFIILVASSSSPFVFAQYYQFYHDQYHTSYSSSDPIINNLEWTFNNHHDTTSNQPQPYHLVYNPIVLDDQSFVFLSLNDNNQDNNNNNSTTISIQLKRFNYNTIVLYFGISLNININQTTNNNNHNNNNSDNDDSFQSLVFSLLYDNETSSNNNEDGTIFLLDQLNNQLYSIDAKNGTIYWISNITIVPNNQNILCSFPQLLNGLVTINCNQYVYMFDRTSGNLINSIEFPSSSDGSTLQSTRSQSTLMDGLNDTLVFIDYTYDQYGQVVVYNQSNTDQPFTVALSYNDSYYLMLDPNQDPYFGQITSSGVIRVFTYNIINRPTRIEVFETVTQLVCNGSSFNIESRYLHDQSVIFYTQKLVKNVDCRSGILSPTIAITNPYIITSFQLANQKPKGGTYLMSINTITNETNWLINNEPLTILDQVVAVDNSIYLCTQEKGVILISQKGTRKSLEFPPLDGDESTNNSSSLFIKSCKLAVGENSLVVATTWTLDLDDNTTIAGSGLLRLGDSVCTELCQSNWTCTTKNCQCAHNYFPASNCTIYCLASETCSGNGNCQPDGTCKCLDGTGYYGDDCGSCQSGYFGGSCNMRFNWVTIGVAGGIATLVTSGIFLFCCLTKPKEARFCCKCCYSRKDIYSDSMCCLAIPFSKCFKKRKSDVMDNRWTITSTMSPTSNDNNDQHNNFKRQNDSINQLFQLDEDQHEGNEKEADYFDDYDDDDNCDENQNRNIT
ncbi:putative cell surface glycoprotein [Cavenderia fasciculata]|uniref:Cell surface glycoprotein n=1 Tax=Cavenderia fasciculata TaxID=261658 RepID=F4Q3L2_CACFS|nr:putative cell surface glycoprotein [Cavenderia fasciculata]EGG17670.1 putative cell surface glycoprotein [Cavenderia fasciculata]|eukprot:XP_004356154.1 putative cell surface glycoprotein [Cavenderia fasciculata]